MRESRRPPVGKRCFTSPVIEEVMAETRAKIGDAELAWLFENCFPNTLDTTVTFAETPEGPDAFVITGDIDAMWLRDSTNQVWPYVQFVRRCPRIRAMVRGLIRRQAKCVLIDAYANAFYRTAERESQWKSDHTVMRPGVHERKYELDSLASVLRLINGYFAAIDDGGLNDNEGLFDELVLRAISRICEVITYEQQGQLEQPYPGDERGYRFQRTTGNATDTMGLEGLGNPYRRTGMSRCGFRPSDDACIFQYLVPPNALAAVELKRVAATMKRLRVGMESAKEAERLAWELTLGIRQHGVVQHPEYGEIFAYEVDGFGSTLLMDDAGPPNLVGLPYAGFCEARDTIYQNTRRFALSRDNPYWAEGKAGRGLTSPHIGVSWIWPLGIITQAMTATEDAEILECLRMLKRTHAGTGFMHEAFRADDAGRFTRDWFAWANTFFGELVLKVMQERPGLLSKALG